MKKLNILILLLVIFISNFTFATEENTGIPAQEQVQKLVAAAWKEPIGSIDITFYKDYIIVPEPVEQVRKRAEEFADRELDGRSLDKLKPYEIERRNKVIETNFKNWVKIQKSSRHAKSRVQISGDKQRIDCVIVGPNEPLGLDTPFVDTFINTKDANTGDFVSYHYAGDINTVFVDTTMWTKETIIQFASIPIAGVLQVFLGADQSNTPTSRNYIPDLNKMQELALTGLASIESMAGVKEKGNKRINKIGIRPAPNAPSTRDIIEMGDPNYFPTVLICDRNDYSRVYRTEFHMPTTNQIIYVRECDNFDSNGFPHNVTEIKYDKDGNFVEQSVYRVIEVKLNSLIPAEVFEFHPPEGYKAVDQRPKRP